MFECPKCRARYDDPPQFCGVCGSRMPARDSDLQSDEKPLTGVVVDSRYLIIDLLGRGGMGDVYRVEHIKIGKMMAMKILGRELSRDPDIRRRFKREAQTVSKLSHVNTVSVFDFGTFKKMMYLVMEYIDGRDLGEILEAEGPIPFQRAARILIQVCSSLREAHSKGIIHRDLKPENIIVGSADGGDEFVKVVDFGLAKLKDTHGKTRLTAEGSLIGTPYYMAPEQIRGEGVEPRSDLYALGAVMYKLITGEVPFAAATPMGIITKHLGEDPAPPSERCPDLEIPKVADEIVLRAMSKKSEDRYASADDMRRVLAEALEAAAPQTNEPRSSSHGDSNWNMGEIVIKPTDGWEVGALDKTVAATGTAPPATDGENAPRTSSLSKSVIVGAREIEIGTKSEIVKFEKSFKLKRAAKIALGIILLIGATAVALAVMVSGQ